MESQIAIRSTKSDHDQDYKENQTTIMSTESRATIRTTGRLKSQTTIIRSTESDHDQDYKETQTTIRSTETVRPQSGVQRQLDHNHAGKQSQITIRNTERAEQD